MHLTDSLFTAVPLFTLLLQYNHLMKTDVAAVEMIHDSTSRPFEIRAPLSASEREKILSLRTYVVSMRWVRSADL